MKAAMATVAAMTQGLVLGRQSAAVAPAGKAGLETVRRPAGAGREAEDADKSDSRKRFQKTYRRVAEKPAAAMRVGSRRAARKRLGLTVGFEGKS
jgi:hypothetical protein